MTRKNTKKPLREVRKLSRREASRYRRQMLVREWNREEGQLKLKGSKVLVVGAGGSGSSLLYYLVAAGIGTIKICDGDKVELTNLNRQILHDETRIGKNKARSAAQTLRKLNSDIEIVVVPHHLTPDNIEEMANDCDVICCAADSHDAMRLLGHYSCTSGIPVVWAGGFYMGGFLTLVQPPQTPCIECMLSIFDNFIEEYKQNRVQVADREQFEVCLQEKDAPNPIVGAAAGAAGALQAFETIKYLLGFGTNLRSIMLKLELGGMYMTLNLYDINGLRRKECPSCGGQ